MPYQTSLRERKREREKGRGLGCTCGIRTKASEWKIFVIASLVHWQSRWLLLNAAPLYFSLAFVINPFGASDREIFNNNDDRQDKELNVSRKASQMCSTCSLDEDPMERESEYFCKGRNGVRKNFEVSFNFHHILNHNFTQF